MTASRQSRLLVALVAVLSCALLAVPGTAQARRLKLPTVSVTAPTAGQTVSGTAVTLDATTSRFASTVTYLVDGVQVASLSGCCNWQTTWDSTSVADGSHSVVARASNSAGTATSAPVSFTVANSSTSPPPPPPPPPPGTTVNKVLVVMEENHSLDEMESGMPYLFGLAQQYGYADNYTAAGHPSLPNYLAIAAGSTFGITDDNDPSAHPLSATTVFGQALGKGETARTYAEAMPSNCYPSDSGNYAVRHNPWTYFTNESTACGSYDVPESSFETDAANNALANVTLLVPDLCDDAHDCSLATADAWLQNRLPAVLNSTDFTSGHLAVVVTADEDDGSQNNTVLTTVLQAGLDGAHMVVSTPLTHYSLSRLMSQVSGSAGLANAATAPDMAAAFGLTVGP